MKKWIAVITSIACAFSTTICADELSHDASIKDIQNLDERIALVESQPDAGSDHDTSTDITRKQVGTAAADGSVTGASNVGKYVLAGTAIAIGVAALILISRHSGHHKHHHHHSH